MKTKIIDRFFKELDRALNRRDDIILVGASAGSLMGHICPSFDIDFEIRTKRARTYGVSENLKSAIESAQKICGVAANYSTNIGGWSRIDYLDYRKTALPYKRIGKLDIKIIAPAYWTIGKMARFLALDVDDIVKIIRAKKLKPDVLMNTWARAVRASDLSLELGHFQKNVIHFLERYGRELWGRNTDVEALIIRFEHKSEQSR